jgi:hypothetical protein
MQSLAISGGHFLSSASSTVLNSVAPFGRATPDVMRGHLGMTGMGGFRVHLS